MLLKTITRSLSLTVNAVNCRRKLSAIMKNKPIPFNNVKILIFIVMLCYCRFLINTILYYCKKKVKRGHKNTESR